MKFVRRSILILVFTLFLLLVAMYVMKTLQNGGELSFESLRDTALREVKKDLGTLGVKGEELIRQARKMIKPLLEKLPNLKG